MSDLVPIPKRGAPDSPHLSRDIPSAFVPISQLLPYARNARTHSDAQVAQIAASIVEWGWTNPILADAKGIVAGHGRLAAARLLYGQGRVLHLPSGEDVPAGCVPCIDVSGWSDTARRAYVLADNQLALQAGWDDAMLAEELRAIRDDGFDISLAGFDAIPELEPIAAIEDVEVDEGNRNELREKWQVEHGQLWQLGKHRLLVGDCTIAENVDRVLDGERADLCFTDPPYGVDFDYDTHNDSRAALVELIAKFLPIARDRCDVVALTPGVPQLWLYPAPAWMLCWYYGVGTGRGPWGFTGWQPVLAYGKDPKLAHGEGCHPDAINALMSREDAELRRELDHSCPKPLSVWCRFLDRLSHKGTRIVFEPFNGSGTTMIACEMAGLSCRAIEIAPAYAAVAIERWHRATGNMPELLS